MDAARNPFAPGAGSPPPELAGRREILERAQVTLERAMGGKHAKSFMLIGLRGVGKTVLLNKIHQIAEERHMRALMIEAHEEKTLPELLFPPLRKTLLTLDRLGKASENVKRALRTLKSFAKTVKIKYGDAELSIDPEQGSADSGDIESDLPDLLTAVGEAAKARKQVVALLIDELQYLSEKELSALIMGMHKVSQRQLPLVLIGAGLPQLVGNMGRSKSYAERLFDFPPVGPLSERDAGTAVAEPIAKEGERIARAAVIEIVRQSHGYPYFLQVWGYQSWNSANRSPISERDVFSAAPSVLQSLDQSFFRVRFDRLTPAEKRYLRAMAELGAGPHRSGDIAEALGVKVQSVAPVRNSLIKKGMIYSPQHGDTAFTVPMFDEFLKRQIPAFNSALSP